jgi:hypothetical protein
MVHQLTLDREFFSLLEQEDGRIAEQVAAAGCPECGGPLHRSDYERKPRGALFAPEGESSIERISLCCGREGCRKRATPPSLRFLGRRVYLGAVVVVASAVAQAVETVKTVRTAAAQAEATGVPPRTTRRWLGWWQGAFVSTDVFVALRARLIGVEVERLPSSMLEPLAGSWPERLRTVATLLAPLTTSSVADGARSLRVVK